MTTTEPQRLRAPIAPRVRRTVALVIEELDNGRWRFSLPCAPDWVVVVGTPAETVRAISTALLESQLADYAAVRMPTLEGPSHLRHSPIAAGASRRDTYDARMWQIDAAGLWISPRGLRYPEASQCVQRVIAGRVRKGLSPRPDPIELDDDWDPELVALRRLAAAVSARRNELGLSRRDVCGRAEFTMSQIRRIETPQRHGDIPAAALRGLNYALGWPAGRAEDILTAAIKEIS